tara:strand:- start:626 stop:754 length:129 start_codon:yes stop_codon:yes gene_type:complete
MVYKGYSENALKARLPSFLHRTGLIGVNDERKQHFSRKVAED